MKSVNHTLYRSIHFDLIEREREREKGGERASCHVVPAAFMTDVIGTHKW